MSLHVGSGEPVSRLMEVATRDGRICLLPQHWQRLYEQLPNTRREGAGWLPPLPLILAGWVHSSDFEKRSRFGEHLRWAATQGAADKLLVYLSALPEEAWHHGDLDCD